MLYLIVLRSVTWRSLPAVALVIALVSLKPSILTWNNPASACTLTLEPILRLFFRPRFMRTSSRVSFGLTHESDIVSHYYTLLWVVRKSWSEGEVERQERHFLKL